MTTPSYYSQGVSPANELLNADGSPNAVTRVLLAHTGTLDTTGHNGATDVVWTRGPGTGDDVRVGVDRSAATINPYLDPTLDPANLPAGHTPAPVYDKPIY